MLADMSLLLRTVSNRTSSHTPRHSGARQQHSAKLMSHALTLRLTNDPCLVGDDDTKATILYGALL